MFGDKNLLTYPPSVLPRFRAGHLPRTLERNPRWQPLLCGLVVAASVSGAAAQERIPNFSSSATVAWQSNSRYGLDALPTGPQPVGPDPVVFKDRPYDMDFDFPVLDVTNPNLQPWVAERLRTQNDQQF